MNRFVYNIVQSKMPLGTEQGRISYAQSIHAESVVDLAALGISFRQKTSVEQGTMAFLTYDLQITTPQGKQSLKLSQDGGVLKYSLDGPQGLSGEVPLSEPVLVLDNNIWCHYQIMVDKLQLEVGNKDSFRFIVPQIIFQFPQGFTMTAEVKKEELLQVGDVFIDCYHVFAASKEANIGVNLWVDTTDHKVVRITIPTQGVEVNLWPLLTMHAKEDPRLGREVSIPGDDIVLSGTLLLPEDANPTYGLVFMHGSGSIDRDGNSGILKTDLYKKLAEAATQQGLASLRYDKRGVNTQDPGLLAHTPTQLIGDLHGAVEFLKKNTTVKQVILVGHSEGGTLVPLAAAERDDVAGVVLMAAPARPLDEIINHQVISAGKKMGLTEAQIEANLLLQAQFYEALEQGDDWIDFLGTPYYAPYFQEHFSLAPLGNITKLTMPVLILHGEWDFQVPVEDAIALEQALTRTGNIQVQLVRFPQVDHLFMPSSDAFSLADYDDISRSIAPAVIDTFNEWLQTNF